MKRYSKFPSVSGNKFVFKGLFGAKNITVIISPYIGSTTTDCISLAIKVKDNNFQSVTSNFATVKEVYGLGLTKGSVVHRKYIGANCYFQGSSLPQ